MKEGAIGQTEGKSGRKCPIEEVYWTKRMEKREKVSYRRSSLYWTLNGIDLLGHLLDTNTATPLMFIIITQTRLLNSIVYNFKRD